MSDVNEKMRGLSRGASMSYDELQELLKTNARQKETPSAYIPEVLTREQVEAKDEQHRRANEMLDRIIGENKLQQQKLNPPEPIYDNRTDEEVERDLQIQALKRNKGPNFP